MSSSTPILNARISRALIHYLVTAEADSTLRDFLAHWAPGLRPHVKILHYEDLPRLHRLATGTYIFSDLELLAGERLDIAVRVWDQLSTAGDEVRLFNDPRKALRRFELLSTLHKRGTNMFAVSRLNEERASLSFPVFMRYEDRHTGSASPLLWTKEDVERTVVNAAIRGLRLRNLMFVEYCDTSDEDGLFRKYSAYFIAGRVVPAHVFFSRRWVVKRASIDDQNDRTLEVEDTYLTTNPHEEIVREVFRVAALDYGRIDYALLGDQPQIWEINTNPHVSRPPDDFSPERRSFHTRFTKQLEAAIASVDLGGGSQDDIAAVLSTPAVASTSARFRRFVGERVRVQLARHPTARDLVRRFVDALAPVFWVFRQPILWFVDRRLLGRQSGSVR
jgi:hypothetical protein